MGADILTSLRDTTDATVYDSFDDRIRKELQADSVQQNGSGV